MANANKIKGGIGFGIILFFIFLVLKLIGYINWSWWWVTLPLWIVPALIIGILLIIWAIYSLVKKAKNTNGNLFR